MSLGALHVTSQDWAVVLCSPKPPGTLDTGTDQHAPAPFRAHNKTDCVVPGRFLRDGDPLSRAGACVRHMTTVSQSTLYFPLAQPFCKGFIHNTSLKPALTSSCSLLYCAVRSVWNRSGSTSTNIDEHEHRLMPDTASWPGRA
jgi:hypothetical protein